MVETVTIPLSWANNIPGASGVEDVTFDVPQVQDIIDGVQDALPDLQDIGQRVDDVTLDPEDVREILGEGLDSVGEGIDITGDVAAAVIDELEAQQDRVADVLIEPLTAAVEAAIGPGGEAVGDIIVDTGELADDIADRIDIPGGGTAQVRFEGVFGPLSQDIQEGVTGALNAVLGDLDELPDDLNSLTEAIEDIRETVEGLDDQVDVPAVEDITDGLTDGLEDLPGGDLLTDPETFISRQLLGLIPDPNDLADSQALEDFDSQVQQLEEEYDL